MAISENILRNSMAYIVSDDITDLCKESSPNEFLLFRNALGKSESMKSHDIYSDR